MLSVGHLCVVLYVLENVGMVAIVAFCARTPPHNSYHPSNVVLLSELLKLLVAGIASLHECLWSPASFSLLFRSTTFYLSAVPAFIYYIMNISLFMSLGCVDAVGFAVGSQQKTFWAVVISYFILGRKYSLRHYSAVSLLMGAIVALQVNISATTNPSEKRHCPDYRLKIILRNITGSQDTASFDYFFGVALVSFSGLCSGLAGVLCERLLKDEALSFWKRNYAFALASCIFGMVLARGGADSISTAMDGILDNIQTFTMPVYVIIILNALGGITIGALIKHVDVIAKDFAQGISLVATCGLSFYVRSTVPPASFWLSLASVQVAYMAFNDSLYHTSRRYVAHVPEKTASAASALLGTACFAVFLYAHLDKHLQSLGLQRNYHSLRTHIEITQGPVVALTTLGTEVWIFNTQKFGLGNDLYAHCNSLAFARLLEAKVVLVPSSKIYWRDFYKTRHLEESPAFQNLFLRAVAQGTLASSGAMAKDGPIILADNLPFVKIREQVAQLRRSGEANSRGLIVQINMKKNGRSWSGPPWPFSWVREYMQSAFHFTEYELHRAMQTSPTLSEDVKYLTLTKGMKRWFAEKAEKPDPAKLCIIRVLRELPDLLAEPTDWFRKKIELFLQVSQEDRVSNSLGAENTTLSVPISLQVRTCTDCGPGGSNHSGLERALRNFLLFDDNTISVGRIARLRGTTPGGVEQKIHVTSDARELTISKIEKIWKNLHPDVSLDGKIIGPTTPRDLKYFHTKYLASTQARLPVFIDHFLMSQAQHTFGSGSSFSISSWLMHQKPLSLPAQIGRGNRTRTFHYFHQAAYARTARFAQEWVLFFQTLLDKRYGHGKYFILGDEFGAR